jgi:tetratricopeptide (TPR) repeat protein
MIRKDDWAVAGACALALACGLTAGGAAPAHAAGAAPVSAEREAVVRGLEAQYAAVLIKERRLADDRETRLLGAAEARLTKARAELSTLKRETAGELNAARADYAKLAAQIVQRDAAAQAEIEAYRAEAEQRAAQATPEELAALQQFADGDRVVAEPVLMSIREARKRATLKAAAMRIAQDERATADEHNVMREHGEATTLEVLKLYDIAAADDPADTKTNLMRGLLSQQEHDYAKAAAAYQQAIAGARTDREREAAYSGLGYVQLMQASFADAEKSLAPALELSLKLLAAEPKSVSAVKDLADCYIQIGMVYRAEGERTKAMASFQSALDAARQADAGAIQILYKLADASEKIGDLQFEGGDAKAALASHTQELDFARRALAMDPKAATARRYAGRALDRIGDALQTQGDFKAALAKFLEHNAIFRELAAEDPTSVYYQQEIAAGLQRLASVEYNHDRDFPRALQTYAESLEVDKRLAAQHPESTSLQIGVAIGYANLGTVQTDVGDKAGAITSLRQALAIGRALVGKDPNAIDAQTVIASTLGNLARMPGSGVTWAEALAQYQAMKARGQLRADMEQYLEEAKRQADAEASAKAKK